MTNCGRDARVRSATRVSPDWCARPWRRSPKTALEPSAGRTPHSVVEIDGAPHLAGVRVAAAPPAAFQIVERSLFRGEGARHRGVVSESTRECGGSVRG